MIENYIRFLKSFDCKVVCNMCINSKNCNNKNNYNCENLQQLHELITRRKCLKYKIQELFNIKRLLYIQVLNENNEFIGYLNTDNSVNTSGDCYFKSESDCNKEIKRFNIRVPYNTYSFKILKLPF